MNGSRTTAILVAGAAIALSALPAGAYVGPGAGLSLLGALWALIVAVAAAVIFLFAWPIRRMRRRRREAMELDQQAEGRGGAQPATDAGERGPAIHRQDASEPRTP